MQDQPKISTEENMGSNSKPKQTVKMEFSVWWLVGLLAAIILLLFVLWHPWTGLATNSRTVSVTGTTTVKAEPDEYVFYPTWEFKGANKTATLNEATEKSATIVSEMKKLGVADNKITTNVGGWGNYYYFNSETNIHTYTLTISATVANRELAQKVQDYLTTTEPTGQVTPQANFSQAKQKELETKARAAATKDARAKADEMAENLGFKVGKVKTIADQNGSGMVYPMMGSLVAQGVAEDANTSKSLAVQPGEQDVTYSIQVTYYIK